MKKLPFPKNSRNITAYFLRDGIGFHFDVPVNLGADTTNVSANAVLRAERNWLNENTTEDNWTPWYIKCSIDGSFDLSVNELLKIKRMSYYQKPYSEESRLTAKIGELLSMYVLLEKGYVLQATHLVSLDHSFGELYRTKFICNTCDNFIENNGVKVAFDVKMSDLKGETK